MELEHALLLSMQRVAEVVGEYMPEQLSMLLGQEEGARRFVAQIMVFQIPLRQPSQLSDTVGTLLYTLGCGRFSPLDCVTCMALVRTTVRGGRQQQQ